MSSRKQPSAIWYCANKGQRSPPRLGRGEFVSGDLRVRRGSEVRRIGSRPGGEAGQAGAPKEECIKTILNTDRLKRLTARIPPRWADDISPATAPSPDAGIAQSAEFLPRDSARRLASSQKCFVPEGVAYVLGLMCYLCARFIPSEVVVWRPIWRLHNKERARYENPLISANSNTRDLRTFCGILF